MLHLVMQLGLEVPSHKQRAMQCRIGVQDGQAFFIWFTRQSLQLFPSVGGQLMIGEATIAMISNSTWTWTVTLSFFVSIILRSAEGLGSVEALNCMADFAIKHRIYS
ncbi:uncharacterized protein HKW66_Vig0069750 [Vigna angularis]|uniref:Uncharacterized protein n=1 Tax=Phaseolus angularis TaxID=3914 RepID=A0A8T0K8S0_PHAAN|nr:uncharacterized protein HKW66_Vig0069750 [Vigna angularis]